MNSLAVGVWKQRKWHRNSIRMTSSIIVPWTDDMANTPKSKPEAKQKALFRDGYRCCISRAFGSLVMLVQQRARNAGINRNTTTACTHIFSESTQEPDKVSNLLAVLSATDHPVSLLNTLPVPAACARVAHMSGAAEQIDSISRDMETMGVLAEDGSNFHILEHALGSRVTAY
ncbi:hypothetical protein HGRIS_011170 [Hohenbuehelia grisea]|uniref:Uncharacterized protein n=1 Tax=Hohenbuehelia grisea TaxID=104357 RepID=A0ABR3JWH5_9AGAR